jgi:hypothetical protein
MSVVIWAPHPDDELIGCYSVLAARPAKSATVYYGSIEHGCLLSSRMFGFRYFNFYEGALEIETWDVVYAPDPDYDVHPEHQWFGSMARRYFRTGRINRLIHYSTQMSVPYLWEEKDPQAKLEALNKCYPEKGSLWEYDHRYWLFTGFCEWHRPVHD